MDTDLYKNIIYYLKTHNIPVEVTGEAERKNIIKYSKHYILRNNLLFKELKDRYLKVVKDSEVEPLLYMLHTHPLGGHLGVEKVLEKVKRQYYWPQFVEDIKKYIASCDECQKRRKKLRRGEFRPIPVGEPFEMIGIDFVGPLPRTRKGNKYIIVAIDYLTKWSEAKAVRRATANVAANFIYDEIICRHGCPRKILSDNGTHFKNELIKNLLERFQVEQLFSTPYHPQTNGLVERHNRTICESIAKSLEDIKQWDEVLPSVLFAYRTSIQGTTKISPFYLTYGRPAVLPMNLWNCVENSQTFRDRIDHLINDLPINRNMAQSRIESSQIRQKNQHITKNNAVIHFEIGDKVLLYDAAKQTQHSGKLKPKWKGPYFVHDEV